MIRLLRKLVYRCGFRPKPYTILFSPTLDAHYAWQGAADAFIKGFEKAKHAMSKIQFLDAEGDVIRMNPCLVCGTTDDQKPTCFRGTGWCCENHRKILAGELAEEKA